jgi:hypothetical protein
MYLRSVDLIAVTPIRVAKGEDVYLATKTQLADHVHEYGDTPVGGVGAESRYDQADFH